MWCGNDSHMVTIVKGGVMALHTHNYEPQRYREDQNPFHDASGMDVAGIRPDFLADVDASGDFGAGEDDIDLAEALLNQEQHRHDHYDADRHSSHTPLHKVA
jgi:hypothetical protein